MPESRGMLLRRPKLTADVITIILLGPGVTEADIAKSADAMR